MTVLEALRTPRIIRKENSRVLLFMAYLSLFSLSFETAKVGYLGHSGLNFFRFFGTLNCLLELFGVFFYLIAKYNSKTD